MKLNEAKQIATKLVTELSPYCDRIEIAGSIRRAKAEPNDIEIVCIPATIDGIRHPEFIAIVDKLQKIKGDAATGKYTQRLTPEGIKLDLFTARVENWGFIYAQRTGSANFSHNVLASGWVKNGYRSVDTILIKNGVSHYMLEEIDVFNAAGVSYVPPENRT